MQHREQAQPAAAVEERSAADVLRRQPPSPLWKRLRATALFGCLVIGLAFGPWGWAAWVIFPLQILRQTMRNRGPLKQRALLALFQLFARFPEACGQIKFMLDRLFGRQARLIEYK